MPVNIMLPQYHSTTEPLPVPVLYYHSTTVPQYRSNIVTTKADEDGARAGGRHSGGSCGGCGGGGGSGGGSGGLVG